MYFSSQISRYIMIIGKFSVFLQVTINAFFSILSFKPKLVSKRLFINTIVIFFLIKINNYNLWKNKIILCKCDIYCCLVYTSIKLLKLHRIFIETLLGLFYKSKKHNNMKRRYNEGEALQSNNLFHQTSTINFTFTRRIILHTSIQHRRKLLAGLVSEDFSKDNSGNSQKSFYHWSESSILQSFQLR